MLYDSESIVVVWYQQLTWPEDMLEISIVPFLTVGEAGLCVGRTPSAPHPPIPRPFNPRLWGHHQLPYVVHRSLGAGSYVRLLECHISLSLMVNGEGGFYPRPVSHVLCVFKPLQMKWGIQKMPLKPVTFDPIRPPGPRSLRSGC